MQSITNIERRHQERNGRIQGTTKTTAAQYAALGEALGPIPPEFGYIVEYNGEIKISNVCVYRESGPILISGEEAKEFAKEGDIFIFFRIYFQGLDMAEGWCGEPEVTVEEADEGATQKTFEHGPQGSKFAGIFG